MDFKKLALILGILVFLEEECSSLDVLSKFFQSDYHLRNLRVGETYINKKFVHNFHAIGYKFNRTTTAFNLTIQLKIDVEDKIELVVQAYKRASNEYRLFPIRFQVNLCKAIETNAVGLNNIVNYGNITRCFWKKDRLYYVRGFLIDESHLPPLMPSGEFKSAIDFMHFKNKLVTLDIYSEVYRPEVVWIK